MLLRIATLADAEPIRAIYNLEVETSTATFDLVPRTLEEQRDYISGRSGAFSVLVAVDDGEIVGFAAISA
ncbi:MAG: N-acetyltransferase family protein, partial [Acidimicrobiia bacterium]